MTHLVLWVTNLIILVSIKSFAVSASSPTPINFITSVVRFERSTNISTGACEYLQSGLFSSSKGKPSF